MKLKRYKNNPILEPNEKNWWESKAVFNPAAVYKAGMVHLLPRVIGEYEKYISRLGYYVSADGLNFERVIDEPVFKPQEQYERWGCEDPRITELEGELFITYVALSEPARRGGGPPRTALTSTKDFRSFYRYGVITPLGLDDKDTVLFPEKIKGKYAVLHRPLNWVGTNYGTDRPSIYVIASAEMGNYSKAHRYFLNVARLDLDDTRGNTFEGIHAASLGGTWQAAINGFAGMRIRDGKLAFNPRLPEKWQKMEFKVKWRGETVNVSVTNDVVQVALQTDDEKRGIDVIVGQKTTSVKGGKIYRISIRDSSL